MRQEADHVRSNSVLSTMLIAASMVLPAAAFAAIVLLRRFALVHYDNHTLTLWLVLDAVILAAGLIVRENDALPNPDPKHRTRRMR